MEEYSCQAVYLDDDVADRHYNGFSNSILWPLFHYHPGEMNFDEANWLAYRQANMRFAEVVRQQVKPGSMVWVQDYHLMLLPMLLRGLIDGDNVGNFTQEQLSLITEGVEAEESGSSASTSIPGIRIGFFLHTPFPSSEIYRYVHPSIHRNNPHLITPSHLGSYLCDEKFSMAFSIATLLASTPMIMRDISSLPAHVFSASLRCRTV